MQVRRHPLQSLLTRPFLTVPKSQCATLAPGRKIHTGEHLLSSPAQHIPSHLDLYFAMELRAKGLTSHYTTASQSSHRSCRQRTGHQRPNPLPLNTSSWSLESWEAHPTRL